MELPKHAFSLGANRNPNYPPLSKERGGEPHAPIRRTLHRELRARIRSMPKRCPSCSISKPLSDFAVRARSRDGYAASCKVCINERNRAKYAADPTERLLASLRATEAKAARFIADPGYKRAFNLWGSTKKRGTKIPSWVQIADFVPICRRAERFGPEYVIDHIIPLRHPLVCGLHVPKNLRIVKRRTNLKKGSFFAP